MIAREQGARQIDGRALRGLGDVARVLRQFGEAERCYQEATTIATDLDTPAELCAVLRRRGMLSTLRGKYSEALDCWVQALALDQRLGHPVRVDLQQKIDELAAEQHLEETYHELRVRYGL
jgi:tetratricopeptide (TPR) repeat protein